ncbi:MAG: hypothetical protein IJT49_09420 [Clostridia bacterium]|nr:hypothetical protein [Clostridia bacterium]
MKKLLTVLLAAVLLTATVSGTSIELPDVPITYDEKMPDCNVTVPDDYIYDLTFTVKSALAKDLKKVIPDEMSGYADGKKVYYITVELNAEQYQKIYNECDENVYLCNVELDGKPVKYFTYGSDKPIQRQFNILMPEKSSVLTLDYFGELAVMMFYQNDALKDEVRFVKPGEDLELPYPSVGEKTPRIWNSMPDASGKPYDQFVWYRPESGKLWVKEDHVISIYAIWEAYTPVIQGDVNKDNELNNKDVVELFRYVSSGTDVDYVYRYDVNGDNVVNNKDVTVLFRLASDA